MGYKYESVQSFLNRNLDILHYDEIIARYKASLDNSGSRTRAWRTWAISAPGVILRDIMEDLESSLEQLKLIAEDV